MKPTFAVACAMLLSAGNTAFAGINVLTPFGPSGGHTFDVDYVAGGAALTLTSQGIYRSTDHGGTWLRVQQFGLYYPGHIAVNPANRSQVLVAAGALFRSADAGLTWTRSTAPPFAPNVTPSKLVFSRDGTVAWMNLANGGLFRSMDGGASWTERSPVANYLASYSNVDVDAAAAGGFYIAGGPAYRTTDGGATWATVILGGSLNTASFAASTVTAGTVIGVSSTDYSGYLSVDAGATWSLLGPEQLDLVRYAPGVAGRVLAIDRQRQVLQSVDDGQNWAALGSIPDGYLTGIAFDPSNVSRLLLARYGGTLLSEDDGATWSERINGLQEWPALQVVTSPAGVGATYMASADLSSVYRRDASTGSWVAVGAAATPLLGYPASLASVNDGFVLGTSAQDENLLYMARDGRFGVSTDGGVSWTAKAPVLSVRSLAVDPRNSQVIYAAARLANAYKSVDGGTTWTLLGGGLPTEISAFAFDPQNSNIVYAAIDNYLPPAISAVYRSMDGGATWNPTAWNAAQLTSLVYGISVDPSNAATLYVNSYFGVHKSTDGGATWTFTDPFPNAQATSGPFNLIIDPQSPNVLYVTHQFLPLIARSVNGGATWDQFGESGNQERFANIALLPGSRTKLLLSRRHGPREMELAADLAVSSAGGPLVAGMAGSITIMIKNESGFAASGVRFESELPANTGAGYNVQATTGVPADCAVTGRQLACSIAVLPGLATSAFSVGFAPAAAGSWVGVVSAYEPDPATASNGFSSSVLAATPPSSGGGGGGGGGGGRLDYLLLVLLGGLALRGLVRTR